MKKYTNKNVFDASKDRLKFIFDEFDNVLISFSGGKDSGVCLNLAYEYAKEHGKTEKLAFYHMDYEAGYKIQDDYINDCFNGYPEIKRKYWLCLPISAQCSVSMHQTSWIPWDKDKRDIWVKEYPESEYVVNEDNVPFKFVKGTYGADARKQFSKWFADEYGKTAVIVGIRTDESLSRLGAITSQHRTEMYKNTRYSKVLTDECVAFYPIYDWRTDDVWTANAKFGWSYNKLYDLFYQSGMSIDQMRTASPFHSCGQNNLKLYRIIEPSTWGKMVGRVNGVNFTGIYGGTIAMGWKNITKPDHFTWKQYAYFLMETLPEETRQRMQYHLERLKNEWSDRGYGRNPEVIETMEKEGIELEHTGIDDKRCTKPGFYEIVKIKGDFPEETSVPMFRKCPNWKGVCITIMKNDFTLQYMGCQRTKTDMAKRNRAMKLYKNL